MPSQHPATCTRCRASFVENGTYLRGYCPACVSLVVTCWAESRYRHILGELAVTTALREGGVGLWHALAEAVRRVPPITGAVCYQRGHDDRTFVLAVPTAGAPATLPTFIVSALEDCVGPVPVATLVRQDLRAGILASHNGWMLALPLRGDEGVLGAALLRGPTDAAITAPRDLAFLATVTGAIGAGLGRAHALGLDRPPAPAAPRRRERSAFERLGWLL